MEVICVEEKVVSHEGFQQLHMMFAPFRSGDFKYRGGIEGKSKIQKESETRRKRALKPSKKRSRSSYVRDLQQSLKKMLILCRC